MPLLLHGDAAFAGQGVVAECFGLSGLRGYRTGGYGPLHRQQPDRLHHRSALQPLLALSVRRAPDGPGADLPRQRRRSRSGGVRRQGGDRVPAALRQGRGHRHVLLPPLRPQRRRRADVHPAADVQEDPPAPSGDARSTASKLVSEGVVTAGEVENDEGRLATRASKRSSRPAQNYGRTAPTGSTGAGRASRPRSDTRTRRGNTAVDDRNAAARSGATITTVPEGLQLAPHAPAAVSRTGARRSRPARGSTGRPPRRSPSARS